MATISLDNIRKSFGKTDVIHGVSMDIADGEFIVIVGPSGCGKSTLLRMVAGLETVTAGEIRIDGERVNDVEPMDRDIAMVFQNYALYPHMSVFDNMAYGLKIRKLPMAEIQARVDKAARILELGPYLRRKPRELSGGQRQRVAIARVMLKDAPVLILDEATSALDSEIEAAIQENLATLMEGKTVIAIAHRLSTIAAMDRLIVVDKGRIVQMGNHAQLLKQRDGLYARLWKRQSGGFLALEEAAE